MKFLLQAYEYERGFENEAFLPFSNCIVNGEL